MSASDIQSQGYTNQPSFSTSQTSSLKDSKINQTASYPSQTSASKSELPQTNSLIKSKKRKQKKKTSSNTNQWPSVGSSNPSVSASEYQKLNRNVQPSNKRNTFSSISYKTLAKVISYFYFFFFNIIITIKNIEKYQ